MFIGIGGGSRSGKTSLTHRIKDVAIAKDLRFKCIHQDELILPEEKLPKIEDRPDWEDPLSVDSEKQNSIIEDAFTRKDIIVIEGIFIHPELKPALDKFIYLELDKASFLKRRKSETRWGEEEDWYLEHVWNSHQEFYNKHISESINEKSLLVKQQNVFSDEAIAELIS